VIDQSAERWYGNAQMFFPFVSSSVVVCCESQLVLEQMF
jgi:hypothetical protein